MLVCTCARLRASVCVRKHSAHLAHFCAANVTCCTHKDSIRGIYSPPRKYLRVTNGMAVQLAYMLQAGKPTVPVHDESHMAWKGAAACIPAYPTEYQPQTPSQ